MKSLLSAALLSFSLFFPTFTQAEEVDLLLVLAADVSLSMDPENLKLQREGYAAAISSPEIFKAVKQGAYGKIAITYVEWGSSEKQVIVKEWTILNNPNDFKNFSSDLLSKPVNTLERTAIGSALQFSGNLIKTSPFTAERKVIDVSGDGPNNMGITPDVVRDQLINDGITINGLPVIPKVYAGSLPPLYDYYLQCVAGGVGHFAIQARSFSEFKDAIKMKLIIEISQLNISPLQYANTETTHNNIRCEDY